MTPEEIQAAVDGVMALRPYAPSQGRSPSRLLDIDRALRQIEFDKLENGQTEDYELRGVRLTPIDHRYTSAKQIEAARKAHPKTFYAQFQHPQ